MKYLSSRLVQWFGGHSTRAKCCAASVLAAVALFAGAQADGATIRKVMRDEKLLIVRIAQGEAEEALPGRDVIVVGAESGESLHGQVRQVQEHYLMIRMESLGAMRAGAKVEVILDQAEQGSEKHLAAGTDPVEAGPVARYFGRRAKASIKTPYISPQFITPLQFYQGRGHQVVAATGLAFRQGTMKQPARGTQNPEQTFRTQASYARVWDANLILGAGLDVRSVTGSKNAASATFAREEADSELTTSVSVFAGAPLGKNAIVGIDDAFVRNEYSDRITRDDGGFTSSEKQVSKASFNRIDPLLLYYDGQVEAALRYRPNVSSATDHADYQSPAVVTLGVQLRQGPLATFGGVLAYEKWGELSETMRDRLTLTIGSESPTYKDQRGGAYLHLLMPYGRRAQDQEPVNVFHVGLGVLYLVQHSQSSCFGVQAKFLYGRGEGEDITFDGVTGEKRFVAVTITDSVFDASVYWTKQF